MHEKRRSSDRQSRRSERKKSKKKKKSRHRSRSRSRERSSHRRSRTPPRSYHSRSSSPSSQLSRSPSRSRSPRHRRNSRSPKKSRYSSSDRSSRSTSRDRKASSKRSLEKPQVLTPEEQLKQKMQKALKAAADADAQLRGIGALVTKNEPENDVSANLSISTQISRANAIDEIASSDFRPQSFVSSRGAPKQHEEELSGHEIAMFGKAIVSTDIGTKSNKNVLILDENNLADEKLFLNVDKKKEKWMKKLTEMRKSVMASNLIMNVN